MTALLNKKVVRFALVLALTLFSPFVLPPHVVGTYIPIVSLLLQSEVWLGEADGAFYFIFFAELFVYFCLFYCVGRFMFKPNR